MDENEQQHEYLRTWGSVVVSLFVIIGFITVSVLIFTHTIPELSHDLALVLFGGLNSMATAVVSYWVGSSVHDIKPSPPKVPPK
jgi:hypothetical protein